MKKYAIYFFDGTLQEYEQNEVRDWSNIVRLHKLIHACLPEDGKLLDMYEDGVGCRENELLLGSTLGKGVNERVEEAYYDIGSLVADARENYDELHVYVFGFSRGAYEARIFSELVSFCGVPGDNGSFGAAMECLTRHDAVEAQKRIGEETFLVPPDIDMLGVFDTVAMTDFGQGIDISVVPDKVRHVCHAMSYNERRLIFPLTRFAPNQPNVEEMWFLGSHTDIGGGYLKRGLADYSLKWMLDKATAYGLPITYAPIIGDKADHKVAFNDSTAGLTKNREPREGDLFHWSVRDERPQFAGVVPPLPPENMIAYSPRPSADTMIA